MLFYQQHKSELPTSISYLHATNERKTGLEYDISEIYKPIIVDRAIFKLINKKMITKDSFEIIGDRLQIKYEARVKLIKEINNKLNQVIKVNNKYLSYNTRIYRDCLSLKNYLLKNEKLSFFKPWW